MNVKAYLILIISTLFSSFTFSEDFVLRCSKYYEFSKEYDTYNILISDDKSAGFLITNEETAYKLKSRSKSDTEYSFTTSEFSSVKTNQYPYSYITINRQNLKLIISSPNSENRVIECTKDNSDISQILSSIEKKSLIFKQKKAKEEQERLDKLRNNTKF